MSAIGMIGRIIGPIGSKKVGQAGSVAWVNGDVEYTYAIGGQPFLVAPGDDNPFQRATAPFRKQQFDSASTPGEQSLDGFWRRSQFSFHKGSGIRYFDAVTDDQALNRSFLIDGLDPWTPGQVSLAKGFESLHAIGHTDPAVGYDGSSTQVIWFKRASDGFLVKFNGSDTVEASVNIGGFAVDPNPGGYAYYIDGNNIKTSNGNTTIYNGLTWAGIWWAKGRLVAMDNVGRFYSLPPIPASPPVAKTSTDAFWTGTGTTTGWSVSDSLNAIFLANGRTVYRALLDTDGTVPTLAAPVVAAELPQDETITAMAYYVGFLVLVGSKGPRIGLTDQDGNVQYGPLLFDWASSDCRTIAASGSVCYFTGKRAGDTSARVFSVNVGQATADGAFAWAVEKNPGLDLSATATGALLFGDDVVAYDGSTFMQADDVSVGSGTLETGYVRFGTMENKAFHSVKVKLGGAGSVAVELIRAGGSAVTLTNLDAAKKGQEVPLNLSSPEEFVGLRFTLTASGSTSPVLLGYTLKALPAPTRQELIQVPLLCYDKEYSRNGMSTGYDNRAWERLRAFKALENNAGELLAQDLRTGEQYVAFIEQSEFINKTPPKGYCSGHGGVLTVTLRKVG